MAQTDFEIAEFLEWARTKPAGESYRYSDIDNCALCQFLRETGRAKQPTVGGATWRDWGPTRYGLSPGSAQKIPSDLMLPLMGDTFGALVERLEKLCPETPVNASNWASIDAYLINIEALA